MKRLLRNLVVRTSGTPLVRVYRGMYRALIAGAAAILRRHRGVIAVYLLRGCVRDDFTPGISDIDLLVVVEDGSPDLAAIQDEFRRMKAATAGLIDYYPTLVLHRATLAHRWRTSPAWRYRYMEGQGSSRLLHGEDVLRDLPPLTELERRAGCHVEMNRWWLLFADRLRGRRGDARDALQDNVVCYKAVSELLGLARAFPSGGVGGARDQAIEGAAGALAARLRRLAAGRFLARDDGLLDATLSFLLPFYVDLWAGFAARPFLEVISSAPQTFDGSRSEWDLGPGTAALLDRLRDHVTGAWPGRSVAVHIVKSAFWGFDDLLMIVEADPANPPAVGEIASLTSLHRRLEASAEQRVFLFLRLGDVAFPLTPTLPQDLHKGLLTPATAPDVFLQLGATEVLWTGHARWFLTEWETNERWPGAPAQKLEQLRVIARSARSGRVHYPLTEPALRRAVAGARAERS